VKLVLLLLTLAVAGGAYLTFGPAAAGLAISCAVLLLFLLRGGPANGVASGDYGDGGALYRSIELTRDHH
jgi:hypothetical protein